MNNKPKRYRLLKDLPDCKAGTILEKNSGSLYMYLGAFDGDDKNSWYISDTVENNPEWFEEISEEITITHFSYDSNGKYIWFRTLHNKEIPKEKFPSIIEAIERVLNNETMFDGKGYNWRLTDEDGQSGSIKLIRKPAKYTQEELDKAIVDAFKAAGLSFSRMGKNFDSAEDYLKSLKK